LNDKLLTPKQAADYLQVDFRTVYSLLRSNKLNGVKVGRVWRISESALQEFIKPNKDK